MLVRGRPRVLISSSIRDFEETRVKVKHAVEELHLADAWLFETSSEASGTGPSEQYLQAARDSDIVVLIVTSEVRQGTIYEYHAAVADNPNKVLPSVSAKGPPGMARASVPCAGCRTCVIGPTSSPGCCGPAVGFSSAAVTQSRCGPRQTRR